MIESFKNNHVLRKYAPMYFDFGSGFPSFFFFADVAGTRTGFLFTSVALVLDLPIPDELLSALSADKDVPMNSLEATQQEVSQDISETRPNCVTCSCCSALQYGTRIACWGSGGMLGVHEFMCHKEPRIGFKPQLTQRIGISEHQ